MQVHFQCPSCEASLDIEVPDEQVAQHQASGQETIEPLPLKMDVLRWLALAANLFGKSVAVLSQDVAENIFHRAAHRNREIDEQRELIHDLLDKSEDEAGGFISDL